MKGKLSSLIPVARCQHRTSTGRQCASLAANKVSGLCKRHASIEEANADVSAPLTRQACRFQNAQGINHSLSALYMLLAQDRISPRRAAVLAYISSLLLRSLDAIDNDRYPNAGRPTPFPAAAPIAASESLTHTNPPSDSSAEVSNDASSSAGKPLQIESDTQPTFADAVPSSGPVSSVGPGTEPLPATANDFVEAVLKRKPN